MTRSHCGFPRPQGPEGSQLPPALTTPPQHRPVSNEYLPQLAAHTEDHRFPREQAELQSPQRRRVITPDKRSTQSQGGTKQQSWDSHRGPSTSSHGFCASCSFIQAGLAFRLLECRTFKCQCQSLPPHRNSQQWRRAHSVHLIVRFSIPYLLVEHRVISYFTLPSEPFRAGATHKAVTGIFLDCPLKKWKRR